MFEVSRVGKKVICKVLGVCLAFLFLVVALDAKVQTLLDLPSQIVMDRGEAKTLEFGFPFSIIVENDSQNVLMFNGETLSEKTKVENNGSLELSPVGTGDVKLSISLFGLVPIKEVTVTVDNTRTLVVGGNSVGVTLYTKGALVVGTSEIVDATGKVLNPARDAGVMPGDIIEAINGTTINDGNHLSDIVNSLQSAKIKLTIKRKSERMQRDVYAARDYQDGKYRLGLWVRDSTVGVGTLTYYDPVTKEFGSLGHAITDVDTHQNLSLKEGEIFQSEIIDVRQGVRGQPGELHGDFDNNSKNLLGKIEKNTEFGIMGKMYKDIQNPVYERALSVGAKEAVHEGAATILSTVDDGGIKEFSCKIEKITSQSTPSTKSMVLKITDKQLLSRTGGIVQGMSGSPIIQDGKLIGAVTHVFVNDPSQGYGVFIEWMLSAQPEDR